MARDPELDRLKQAQDLAFQRKQEAHLAQQRAWERRVSVRDTMNRAHEVNQRLYFEQERAWQYLQGVRNANSPRIDLLNAQQESAFQNMKRSFDAASSAHDRRDGAAAASYAADGRRYKEEAQRYVAERRRLVDEIRAAGAQLEVAKPAFQSSKDDFQRAKLDFTQAKSEHERAQAAFKSARADFDRTRTAFQTRLATLKGQNKKNQLDKRAVAEKAGVPHQYRDNVWVSRKPDGSVNIYFGGLGAPNGPGHGHYALDPQGILTYRREPSDVHGVHNFQKADLYMRSARRNNKPMNTNEHGGVFYRRSDTGGTSLHITQYFADNYHVSWDATPYGNKNIHWTNQNLAKGDPARHNPPSDAAF